MKLVKRETPAQAQGHAEKRTAARQTARAIGITPCPYLSRLRRMEAAPATWLRFHFPQTYRRPFGTVHHQIIDGCQYAMTTGGRFGAAAPRGTGKSRVEWGMALWAVITGRRRFAAVIPWSDREVKMALRFWAAALVNNPQLLASYPELCAPFAKGQGGAQRVKTLVWDSTGPNPGQPTGARLTLSQGLIVLPDSRGVIGSGTLNGNVRGMSYDPPSGATMRPDIVIIDDPSDKDTARSDVLTRRNIEYINEDVLGMAGPDVKLAAVMAATILSRADTASHYLGGGEPDWQAVIVPQIETWPTDMALWDDWNAARLEGLTRQDHAKSAKAFYRKHRSAMRAGFAVSWIHRYDRALEPDAYYAAMSDFYSLGRKAFMQERQNAPESDTESVYTITVDQVQARVNGMEPNAAQHDGLIQSVGIDVNQYALTWAALSICNDMAAAVMAYGVHPGGGVLMWSEESGTELATVIHSQLIHLARQLSTRFPALDRIVIDGNFQTDLVYRAVEMLKGSLPCRVVAGRGLSSQKFGEPRYARAIKRRGEQCHEIKGQRGLSLVFNSHHWHKAMQTGFLAQPLLAGSVSLFGKPGDTHRLLAEHVCRDSLESISTQDGREVHKWRQGPGRNDLADAVVMALVGAAIEGASANAERAKPKPVAKRTITALPARRW